MDALRFERALHSHLLAADPDEEVGRAWFELLISTNAAPLWRAVGARLAGAAELRAEVAAWCREALADGAPAWRLQPLCGDAAVTGLLLDELKNASPRARVAAIKGLAPRVHEPEFRDALLACFADGHDHVRSTAVEVLRPVVEVPAVRDALLTLVDRQGPTKGRVDRALRRSLRVAAGDPQVQAQLLRGLREPRGWIAAEALAGAPASKALVDALLAVLERSDYLSTIAGAFMAVAADARVTAALLARMQGQGRDSDLQWALRIVGRGVTTEARDAVIAELDHETNWIRWTALQQLGHRLADPVSRAAVFGRLADVDDSVRMIALKLLAAIADDPDARAAARTLLADPSDAVRIAAAGLLARTEADPAAWVVLAPHVTVERTSVYTKSWQSIDPFAEIGRLIGLVEVRDAVAPMLGAYRADRRTAVARCMREAPPDPAIAERLAELVVEDEPAVAGAAYETLLAWVSR